MKQTHFKQLECIGRGSFGTVYKCRSRETDQIVCLKAIPLQEESHLVAFQELKMLQLVQTLHHPHITKLIDNYIDYHYLILVFEYYSETVSLSTKTKLFQLLHTIQTLYETYNLVHMDIKSNNILFTPTGLKIIDFGNCQFASTTKTDNHLQPSLWYRAPELLMGCNGVEHSMDIWSIGCLFAQWLQLDMVYFRGENEIDQLCLILQKSACTLQQFETLYHHCSHFGKIKPIFSNNNTTNTTPHSELRKHCNALEWDLLSHLLDLNPSTRWTAKQALGHDYFKTSPLPQIQFF